MNNNGQGWLLALILVLIVILIGAGIYYYASEPAEGGAEANYTVVFRSLPTSVSSESNFSASWTIEGLNGNITSNAIYYGSTSRPVPNGSISYPSSSVDVCRNPSTRCIVPGNFSVSMNINQTGAIYARIRAIIDGQEYWSNERVINVNVANVTNQTLVVNVSNSTQGNVINSS